MLCWWNFQGTRDLKRPEAITAFISFILRNPQPQLYENANSLINLIEFGFELIGRISFRKEKHFHCFLFCFFFSYARDLRVRLRNDVYGEIHGWPF